MKARRNEDGGSSIRCASNGEHVTFVTFFAVLVAAALEVKTRAARAQGAAITVSPEGYQRRVQVNRRTWTAVFKIERGTYTKRAVKIPSNEDSLDEADGFLIIMVLGCCEYSS